MIQTMLITEIDWDASGVLALSLPRHVLIIECPDDVEPEDERFQRFMQARFGAGTTGCVGYSAGQHMDPLARSRNQRMTVEMVVWEE